LVDRLGYDSLWVGDHLSFAIPILDPFIQLAQAAAYSPRLTLGVGIYLLPLRHPGPVAKQVASLDHSIWFHRKFRMDDWLLHVMKSPSACKARGLNIGSIYTREGTLVASIAQEGLLRRLKKHTQS